MKKTLLTLAAVAIAASAANAQLVFSENFGTLADGTTITTSNTDLTYVRVGTGTGSISAENPSSFGSGASALIIGPTNTSLNGIGVSSGLTSSRIYDLSFDFRLTDTSGDFVIGVGTGNAFTQNTTFATNNGLFWLQADGTNFERRTSSAWEDVTTLTINTNYSLRVLANGSASAYGELAAGTMDIYLNGTLVADGVAVTTSLNADAFRLYSISGTDVEIDNIVVAVPEPHDYALGIAALLAVMAFVRRRSFVA